jgi:hypothetical protein
MKLNAWFVLVAGSVITTLAIAKLPAPAPLTDEQKAKAAEAKEKAADAAKKDAADLGRYQDKSSERYFREMKAAGKAVPPSTWVPPAPAPVSAPAAPAAAPAAVVAPAAAPAKKA